MGNGNITTDHRGRTYGYDAENMLRVAHDNLGATIATYNYYGDGTRAYKYVNGVGTTGFFYEGDQEMLETDGTWPGNALRRYIRLPGPRVKARRS